MQPARADVVQNLTLPLSAATAADRHVVVMSMPAWAPFGRASP
jgi:hypothetical protein